jgi:hypothetical protein
LCSWFGAGWIHPGHSFVAGDRFVAALRRTTSACGSNHARCRSPNGRITGVLQRQDAPAPAADASAPAQPDPDRADRWLPATHARIIRSLIMQLACWRWWPPFRRSVRSAALASSVITRVVDRWRWIERPAALRGAGRTKETAEHHTRTPPATLRERPPMPCHAMLRLQPTQGPAGTESVIRRHRGTLRRFLARDHRLIAAAATAAAVATQLTAF